MVNYKRVAARIRRIACFAAPLVLLAISSTTVPAHAQAGRVLHISSGISEGSRFSNPLGIFFDRTRRECYVADTGNHQISIFDKNGLPLHHFSHTVIRNGRRSAGEPKSIAVDGTGRIFLIDASTPYVTVLDPLGRSIAQIQPPTDGCSGHQRFNVLGLGPREEIFATLSCEYRHIAVIGPELSIIRIVSLSSQAQTKPCITAMAIDETGTIYIADPCGTDMVQIYDHEGNFLSGFGQHDTGFENFSYPTGIAVMTSGEIWIVDAIRQIASRFTRNGQFLSYIGGKGSHPGAFEYPSGIATDGESLLFVLERIGERYQCFQLTENERAQENIQ